MENLQTDLSKLIQAFSSQHDCSINASALESRLLRILRPTDASVDSHSQSVKNRLKKRLLRAEEGLLKGESATATDVSGGPRSEGVVKVAQFEKLCEAVRRSRPELVVPFLAFLESLPRGGVSNSISSRGPFISFPSEERGKVNNNGMELPVKLMPSAALDEGDNYREMSASRPEPQWISREIELISMRQLLCIFQGLPAKHIHYDTRSESYSIDPSLELPGPAQDAILSLCELGFLYAVVAQYQSRIEQNGTVRGLVVQAFGFALQEELHDYFRLLAIVERELVEAQNRNKKEQTDKENIHRLNADVTSKPPTVLSAVMAKKLSGSELPSSTNLLLSKSSSEESEEASRDQRMPLTLLRMKSWLQEPMDRMCLLSQLTDSCSPLEGGALLARLFKHTQHGDVVVSSVVGRIIKRVCRPFYSLLTRWILYGDLYDPFQEFFIAVNDVPRGESIWHAGFVLRWRMLPSFLSRELARQVLIIGKSINFIRLCKQQLSNSENASSKAVATSKTKRNSLGRKARPKKSQESLNRGGEAGDEEDEEQAQEIRPQWLKVGRNEERPVESSVILSEPDDGQYGIPSAIEKALKELDYGDEANLQQLVSQISHRVDQRLLTMLMNDFHLEDHLLALKKFILLGQGDFVTCLMDAVGPELQKPPNKLYRHNLMGILDGAKRSSNAQFEPNYVLDRVGVRLLEAFQHDSGWEVFTLDYVIDAPLDAVVHQDAMSKYRIAFHMLWRLKRVEWSLSSAWKQLMTLSHSAWRGYGRDGREAWRGEFPKLLPVLHRCTLSRSRMTHVVNNLGGFLMFEVLESAWDKLCGSLHTAKSVQEVIEAHDKYLADIMDRALLSVQHEALNMQIQRLLSSILRFCTVESSLMTDASVAMTRRRRGRDDRARQGFSHLEAAVFDPPGSYDGVPAFMVTRVDDAVRDFSTNYAALMEQLHETGEKMDHIRFLRFRLEFSSTTV